MPPVVRKHIDLSRLTPDSRVGYVRRHILRFGLDRSDDVGPFREVRCWRHGVTYACKGGEIMRSKDLRVSIAALKAIETQTDIEPEQKRRVGVAISRLKRLQRKREPSKAEVYRCVREVTEALVDVFLKNR
jgi:hypothetical protein